MLRDKRPTQVTGACGIFRRGSGQRKIHAAIQRLPRGPRGVVEGGLDSMIGMTCVCHLVGCGVHTWCLLPVCRCSFVS